METTLNTLLNYLENCGTYCVVDHPNYRYNLMDYASYEDIIEHFGCETSEDFALRVDSWDSLDKLPQAVKDAFASTDFNVSDYTHYLYLSIPINDYTCEEYYYLAWDHLN